jgi:hypothetical protein
VRIYSITGGLCSALSPSGRTCDGGLGSHSSPCKPIFPPIGQAHFFTTTVFITTSLRPSSPKTTMKFTFADPPNFANPLNFANPPDFADPPNVAKPEKGQRLTTCGGKVGKAAVGAAVAATLLSSKPVSLYAWLSSLLTFFSGCFWEGRGAEDEEKKGRSSRFEGRMMILLYTRAGPCHLIPVSNMPILT